MQYRMVREIDHEDFGIYRRMRDKTIRYFSPEKVYCSRQKIPSSSKFPSLLLFCLPPACRAPLPQKDNLFFFLQFLQDVPYHVDAYVGACPLQVRDGEIADDTVYGIQ